MLSSFENVEAREWSAGIDQSLDLRGGLFAGPLTLGGATIEPVSGGDYGDKKREAGGRDQAQGAGASGVSRGDAVELVKQGLCVRNELGCGLIAEGGVLLQRAVDDGAGFGRELWVDLPNAWIGVFGD